MVDALVLEASTSVCGFESHLPHQKKRAPKGAFFFWRPLRRGLPLRSMCGRNLRFPHTRPLPFCDTIQFGIETDRSYHRPGPGAEWRSGLFSLPQICAPVPANLSLLLVCTTGFPKTALPEFVPQSGTPKLFTFHYSLFTRPAPAFPSRFPGAPESCSQQGRRISSPAAMRDCKTLFPSACRAQAHSEPVPQSGTPKLFTLLYSLSQPCPFSLRDGQQNKNIFYFLVT